jgi:hypothetical protein
LAKLPELGAAPQAEDPADVPGAGVPTENPLLAKLELELADGRYLLAYRRLEAAPADA